MSSETRKVEVTTTTTTPLAASASNAVAQLKNFWTDSNSLMGSNNEVNAANLLANNDTKINGTTAFNSQKGYVDFNQFMAQHNFLAHNNNSHNNNTNNISNSNTNVNKSELMSNNGGFVAPENNLTHVTASIMFNNQNNGDLFYGQNNYNQNYALESQTYGNNNALQALATATAANNANYTQYNNGSLNNYNNGYNNSMNSLIGDYSVPFGVHSNHSNGVNFLNGTTGPLYISNAFSTGFDLSDQVGPASQLQASAPEFVPRFQNLTIGDRQMDNENLKICENSAKQTKNAERLDEDSVKHGARQNEINFNPTAAYNNFNEASTSSSTLRDEEVSKATASASESNENLNGSVYHPINSETYTRGSSNYKRNRNFTKENHHHRGAYGNFNGSASSPTSTPPHRRASAARAAECDNRRFQQSHSASNSNLNGRNSNSIRTDEDGGVSGGISSNASGGNNGSRNNGAGNNNNSRFNYEQRNNKFERYERPIDRERNDRERVDRNEKNGRNYRDRERERDRDYHQQRDNYRSNKRRDDWNRNRDRINGFRLEEKYSSDNGKESPLPSPEKKASPKKLQNERNLDNEKLSQREKLIRDIETRRLECLVCVEAIKSHQSVWSCHNCYHILHLQCITKWASSSKSDDGWRCPACQNTNLEIPRDYYCFCGKVKSPQFNRQDTAHSCGETCGRVEGCSHACTLLCHPGPCPPCQASVTRNCGCGKTTKTMQCCLKETITCDAVCGKSLNCELHACAATCHEGKCEPCAEKVEQTCHCSKQEREVTCTRDTHDKRTYSCGKPCGKDLACGNHKCKDCCHAGECRPCKLSPAVVTSCPCGKMPLMPDQRSSCLDAIPVCEGVCGKTLRCGKATHPHHCTAKCHAGNCPPCNKQTAVKCRCGHMDQMIKCRQLSTRADDARCKKRCVKKRSCGKHKCNQECCIDIDHICPLPCNHTLSCGKHKCDQSCHRGNCPRCYRSSFEELYCECGAEVIYPPVPCGTKRPVCKRPCSRTHPCEHPPQHNCHSAPTCPPCMMFTTKYCFGKHEQRKTIPCSQESFSCGKACNKPLPCGRHKCIKVCHEGPCQAPGEICKQSCTTARSTCGHKCMSACHEGVCPDTPCKEMVEVQCECGNRKQMRTCNEVAREYSRIATAQLASSMAEMQRGNYMELSEILAPMKVNKTNKTLDCNEDCRLVERNRRLAIGLQIRNPDTSQKLLTKYSDFMRTFAKRDPALVKSIYDTLTNLVKLAKESKQKSRSHSFPVMNREKRQVVHELCEMFGVESVAYDAEPNRNVVAIAYKERSWLPATSIMDVMQREAGQRRVPVPTNNPWNIKK